MKFVYFGYDFMLPSALRLIDDGHELVGIMSFECDNIFNFNQNCQNLSQQLGIPFIVSPASDAHIDGFIEEGCECFLSAGYPHKIPPIDETKARAINIHPTHLPAARGVMPIPHIIINQMDHAAGLTAHKMTQEFDEGDILVQYKINLDPRETVETYSAKIAVRAPDIVSDLFKNLDRYWKNAKPQTTKNASKAPPPTDDGRTFDWTKTVQEIDTIGRAFGRFGSIATFDDKLWVVYSYDVWEEEHNHPPGHIAARLSREIVIAAANGYICLKDYQLAQMP